MNASIQNQRPGLDTYRRHEPVSCRHIRRPLLSPRRSHSDGRGEGRGEVRILGKGRGLSRRIVAKPDEDELSNSRVREGLINSFSDSCVPYWNHEPMPPLAVSSQRAMIPPLLRERAGVRASFSQPRHEALTNWLRNDGALSQGTLFARYSTSPNPKSTPANPESTVDLGLEPLIWVENTLLTPIFSGAQRSLCPITTRERQRKHQKKTETNQKIYQARCLDLGCAQFANILPKHFAFPMGHRSSAKLDGDVPREVSLKKSSRTEPLNRCGRCRCKRSADDSPSPGGEGRGEGGLNCSSGREPALTSPASGSKTVLKPETNSRQGLPRSTVAMQGKKIARRETCNLQPDLATFQAVSRRFPLSQRERAGVRESRWNQIASPLHKVVSSNRPL